MSCSLCRFFQQLTGCTKYKRPVTVGDDTPLVHLLSYSVDGEQGSDLLYAVISDIVSDSVLFC